MSCTINTSEGTQLIYNVHNYQHDILYDGSLCVGAWNTQKSDLNIFFGLPRDMSDHGKMVVKT